MVFLLNTPQKVQKMDFSGKKTGLFWKNAWEVAKFGNFVLEMVSKGNIA